MHGLAQRPPVVLVFSGLDPSGGAGIQADIEALASMGCHAAPLITSLTVQDTRAVRRCTAVDPALLAEQVRVVTGDMPVAACKIGLISEVETVEVIQSALAELGEVPLVLDPVLSSGAGDRLAGEAVRAALCERLISHTTILTPNIGEARRLAGERVGPQGVPQALLDLGAELVLITGADQTTGPVVNRLYSRSGREEAFRWERLPNRYHGSGCTLASTIAGLLAHGLDPFRAAREAQQYTWESLRHGYQVGEGQHLPNRLYWAQGQSPSQT